MSWILPRLSSWNMLKTVLVSRPWLVNNLTSSSTGSRGRNPPLLSASPASTTQPAIKTDLMVLIATLKCVPGRSCSVLRVRKLSLNTDIFLGRIYSTKCKSRKLYSAVDLVTQSWPNPDSGREREREEGTFRLGAEGWGTGNERGVGRWEDNGCHEAIISEV